MASLTQWTCIWVSSGSWWWTGKPGVLQSLGLQWVGHNWATEPNWTEWFSDFPYFLQFKSEFGNKEFMIWATFTSQSCLCWLCRASPSLVAKNIINLISVLTIWWYPCVESSLVLLEEGVNYDQGALLAKLSKPLPCFILYSKAKSACYSRYLLTFCFGIPVPYDEKGIFFSVSSRKSCRSSRFLG